MIPAVPIVLLFVLGASAVAAFWRRAWTIAAIAGLLALGVMWIATEPLAHPAQHVVDEEQQP